MDRMWKKRISAIEVAGYMGAMATTNRFTVESMRTKIKKSNHTIAQL
jgi:hypothetical protein